MRSLITVLVEHGETTDGVNECLFDMGIGSQLDPYADDQWPTADDGATWPRIEGGIDYRVIDYTVEVDIDKCNHHCEITPDNLDEDKQHYLNCPVWTFLLERAWSNA